MEGAPAERVSLNALDDNHAAISLYLQAGFLDVSRPTDEPLSPGPRYMKMRDKAAPPRSQLSSSLVFSQGLSEDRPAPQE